MSDDTYSDPNDYAGQLICICCGADPDGKRWPNCVDWRQQGGDADIAHLLTCDRYWFDGNAAEKTPFMCNECMSWLKEADDDH